MGNFLSSDSEFNICLICNKDITDRNNKTFLDMECSKCKQRSKGYYHNACFKNYLDRYKNSLSSFTCVSCIPRQKTTSELLPQCSI